MVAAPALASEALPAPAPESDGPLWELSPFEVRSDAQGYAASNAISGTRLNVRLQNLPMSVEIVTEEFLDDIGATDLREALRYSAGVLLESQNDAGSGNSYDHAGGVHNPEGASANRTETSYKMRGFLTDSTLRNGYRRQAATDSINIDRIEVVYGPSALLYGVGNFGGVVNYLTKNPLQDPQTEVGLIVGTDEFRRATLDTTGPLASTGGIAYRLTGAWESSGHWTEWRQHEHRFLSPALTFFPTTTTKASIDFEHGKSHDSGVGFQSLRARVTPGFGDQDQLERAAFLEFDGENPRTFRWSGPDTYTESVASNLNLQVIQEMGAHWHALVGFNRSQVIFDERDVIGALLQNVGPPALRATVQVRPLDSIGGDSEFEEGRVENAVLQYLWTDLREKTERTQVRVELGGRLEFLPDQRWFRNGHQILFGFSEEQAERRERLSRTGDAGFNYKNPTDSSPIRFDLQGDGLPSVPLEPLARRQSIASNQGFYAVWQGRFFEDRVSAVAGLRRDRNDLRASREELREKVRTESDAEAQRDWTEQFGLIVELAKGVSVYALRSEGLQPNFDGLLDLGGDPIRSVRARSEEVGLKIELVDGRLAGRVSAYRIHKSGSPIFYFWAPSPAKGRFDPARPIIYNVSNFSPSSAPGGSNGGNGAADLALPAWQAAVAAGAAFQQEANGALNWYLNASRPEGAAYLDAVFAATHEQGGWPGWLYLYDEHTNTATMDWASPEATSFQAYATGDAESSGWEAQVYFSPIDDLQIVASYAQTTRRLVNAGRFVRYPFPEDRWAIWYFPNDQWGLSGFSQDEAYADPTDTSTWRGLGHGSGEARDDTPLHNVSLWTHYRFEGGWLEGLSIGLGGQWESEREYFSGVTDGGGQLVTDPSGRRVVLRTNPRLNLDAMLRYNFTGSAKAEYAVQLNVYNLTDDRDRYGLLYAPGISGRLSLTASF